MANTTYYYEVPEELENIPPGIYSRTIIRGSFVKKLPTRMLLALCSERIWVQGPKGGVRITKEYGNPSIGYVTKNDKKMKEFMWVKLKAQEI